MSIINKNLESVYSFPRLKNRTLPIFWSPLAELTTTPTFVLLFFDCLYDFTIYVCKPT